MRIRSDENGTVDLDKINEALEELRKAVKEMSDGRGNAEECVAELNEIIRLLEEENNYLEASKLLIDFTSYHGSNHAIEASTVLEDAILS